jgi:hypothetical protein
MNLYLGVMAEVECEIEATPERIRIRDEFRATRPANWKIIAWEQTDIWRELFRRAKHDDHRDVYQRWAIDISETRYEGWPWGIIESSRVPRHMYRFKKCEVSRHPTDPPHLARFALHLDKRWHGELLLDEKPGAGRLSITEEGLVTTETYAKPAPWTYWVETSIERIVNLVQSRRGAHRRSRA